jgi:hypothetical protein
MEEIVEILAVAIAGPMVGVEIAVAAFANPIFARLPDDAFRMARSSSSRLLGRVMPFWYAATLALLIAVAVVTRNWLAIVAAGVMAAVLLMTVTVLVPINNRIAAAAPEEGAPRELAARWDRLHWLRVGLLVVLFVLLAIAVAT